MTSSVNFLGSGWAFPILPDRAGRLRLTADEEAVRNSISLILSTAQGERVMRPDFGCGIHELVFQPNTATLRGAIATQVRTSLMQWEPRIDVLDVSVQSPADAEHHLIIRIDYRLRQNNALFNLVYPFFLQEGAG